MQAEYVGQAVCRGDTMELNLNGSLDQATQQGAFNGAKNLTDILGKVLEPKKSKEVSLSTLSKKQIAKIMASAQNGLKIAKNYYTSTVEAEVTRRTQIYDADKDYYKKKFPRLSEKTTWRSRDVQTACEWILPSLLEAFTGGDEPIDIKGASVEDDAKAKQLQNIVAYQMARKNDLHSLLTFCFEESLRSNFGVAKVYWKHEEERTEYPMLIPNGDIDTALSLAVEVQQGNMEIKKVEPLPDAPDLIKVVFEQVKVTANYPVIEFLSPSELLFTPEAATLQSCKFVAHRKIVTGDYLKRKEDEVIYRNVDEAIKKSGNITPTSLETANNKELDHARQSLTDDDDDASKYVELLEAYIDVDYNNDGKMEHMLVHMVDDVPLRIAINDFGFVPFFPCCSKYSPNKVFGDYSFSDLIEQQQDLKTALVKQMIINIAQQNAGQKLVDPSKVDFDALLDGDEFVNVDTSSGAVGDYIYSVATPQLSPYTMELLQYAQNEVESQTGSTKYNQGLDSNSLNKTATGISMIMSAADKRIKLMARSIAERFYVPLVKAIIILDQKYMHDDEVVRIDNKDVVIRREDLDIDYDLIINVGAGAGTKEARIQYLMILINQLIPMLLQSGVANEDTIYNAAKDLLQEMGLRSTLAFLQDPNSPEAQQAKAQAQQQQQQQLQLAQQMKAQEQQVEMLKAILPRISIKYEDLPITAKTQLLNVIGLGVDTGEIIAKELLSDGTLEKKNPPLIQAGENPQPGLRAEERRTKALTAPKGNIR